MENLEGQFEELTPMIVEHGLSVVGAIVILMLGWWLAGWGKRKVVAKASASKGIDDTLVPILGQTIKILILVITILAVLGQFGIETTSIVAVLGASALAVGLALQGTLSNVAAGVMLLILRPFKVGDAVNIGGTTGVVDSIGLFTTEMHSFDNIGISMPNSNVWGTEIQNMSKFEKRRVDMVFGIDYSDDMDKAMEIIKKVLDADERVLKDPAPQIAVSNLGDSSVDIIARPWVENANVWPLRFDVTKKVKEEFDKNDVSFPFPQTDVHLFKEN
ncbi:mechanosensitive ion channel family protein [Rhodohalobacter barkolensis]|uniref:Mechanosensitive ion channel protein MscS n=1 Tax=Rhodohalobacter barkolensis TaxID=2053187 RepID=A0A2N0VG53_9BACT|nr:mechanosensitive ion channel domain-containing protein [Rhodohalobacter barkolensis]PKD43175.1 mechanosensitive ion channel protein MscS [Rhodohalobacter barkolensis]